MARSADSRGVSPDLAFAARRRRVLGVIVPLGAVATLVALVLRPRSAGVLGTMDGWFLGLLAGCLALIGVTLRTTWASRAESWLVTLLYGSLAGRLLVGVAMAEPGASLNEFVPPFHHWLPIVVLVGYLILPSADALVRSALFLAVGAGAVIAWAVATWADPANATLRYALVEQYLVAHPICLALTHTVLRLRSAVAEGQLRLGKASSDARTDPLTGLANRRGLQEAMQELELTGEGAGVALLDLDHFKALNDTHGHATGDTALVAVARALAEVLREGDVVGRWGGEEFLVLLRQPEPDMEAVGERLRERVARVAVAETLSITAWLGVTRAAPEEPLEDAIERADRALYAAKHAGRNCVRAA